MDATDLCYANAAEQARLIGEGQLSAVELTQTVLDRIERVEPTINSYRVVLAEQALVHSDAHRRPTHAPSRAGRRLGLASMALRTRGGDGGRHSCRRLLGGFWRAIRGRPRAILRYRQLRRRIRRLLRPA